MNYRCNRCGARRSGSRRRKFKNKVPECCGQLMRNDTANVKRWNAKQPWCDCGVIPFKHREGSDCGKHGLCAHHPDFDPWGSKMST